MSESNALFITASRAKFRFPFSVGQLSAEDLWDLPLSGRGQNLDNIARALHKELKSRKNVTLQLLWEEYKQAHPQGYAYSWYCELYRAWQRHKAPPPRMHNSHNC